MARSNRRRATALLVWGMIPGAAWAQTASPLSGAAPAQEGSGPAQTAIEEIVVTARRSEENLQTTPVAVTALTPSALEARQVENLNDFVRAAPSLTFQGGGNASSRVVNLSIRGQAQGNAGSSNDPAVGVYIDGVYQARMNGVNVDLVDMASAEVLRGPQGTLFGRNTTGGALNLATRGPTDRFEGYARVGVGDYDQRLLEGVLNIPVSPTLSTRFAGRYEKHDGYVQNANTGDREADVVGNYYGRGSLLWRPGGDRFKLRVTGDYARYRDSGSPPLLRAAPNAGPLSILQSFQVDRDRFYRSYNGVTATGSPINILGFPVGSGASGNVEIDTPNTFTKAKSLTVNADARLSGLLLKSITGFKKSDVFNSWDLDAAPLNLVGFAGEYNQKQFSQEFTLTGERGELDWIVGLYYFRESGAERTDAAQFGSFSRDAADFVSKSRGIFAQLNYKLTDSVRATGGLRYTWDERTVVLHGLAGGVAPDFSDAICTAVDSIPPAPRNQCDGRQGGKFHYPAWLLSFDYQMTPMIFSYVKTSGASLAGGVNFRITPPGQEEFEPENVRDVELGVKADWLDRRLRTNLALFHIWRNDVQANVLTVFGGRSTQYQVNGGNARQYGFELEQTARPWRGMEIIGSLSYLKSRYQAGSFITPNAAGTGVVDRSGQDVGQAPVWNWNIGATQTFAAPFGEVSVHVDYAHVGGYNQNPATLDPTSPLNTPELAAAANRLARVPSYEILNARLAVTLRSPDIEIAVWARNLTDEKYYINAFTALYAFTGVATATGGAPRTYGASVAYRF